MGTFYFFSLLLPLLFALPTEDLVTNLPLAENFKKDFQMYSGYLPIAGSNGKELHYVFVTSKNKNTTDPLVLWLNGGPGCSSMEGAFMETGPFYFSDDAMIMHENPYSWNRNASMLYLEAPAGVGYSKYGDIANLNTNDNTTADDNLQALVAWFSKFPEYISNDFYIAGESYAGIYIPMLADRVLTYNKGSPSPAINLKGFAVGNGVVDWKVDADEAWPYVLWWHGLIGYDTWSAWESNSCTVRGLVDGTPCADAYNEMMHLFTGINYYDIYQPCIYGSAESRTHHKVKWKNLEGILNCVPDIGLTQYMNLAKVREALHIDSSLGAWEECSSSLNYTISDLGSFYLYPELIKSGLKILIYSGDTDTAVAPAGTRQWIKKLDMARKESWTAWELNNQVAGFYEVYNAGLFTFMTIKGSGHMCVQWKRPEGFHMFTSFLQGEHP